MSANVLDVTGARAFRGRDMLESGEYSTIRKMAAAEKINERPTWSACCT
jgi:hypothetical protein